MSRHSHSSNNNIKQTDMADDASDAPSALVEAPPPPYEAVDPAAVVDDGPAAVAEGGESADCSAEIPVSATNTSTSWDMPSFLLTRYAQLAASINTLDTADRAIDEQRFAIDRMQTHLHNLAAREQELSQAVNTMAWRSKYPLNLPLLAGKVTGKPLKDPVGEAHLDHFRSDNDLAAVRSEIAATGRELDAARARLPALIAASDPKRLAELHAERERLMDLAFSPPVPIPEHDQAFSEMQALTETLSK
ncbi:hypothetical protein HK405_007600, partial [Cladochytrium tenue]